MKKLYFILPVVLLCVFSCKNNPKAIDAEQGDELTNQQTLLLPKQSVCEMLLDSSLNKLLVNSKLFLIKGMPCFLTDSMIFPLFEEDSANLSVFMIPDNLCPDDMCFGYDSIFWFIKGENLGYIQNQKLVDSCFSFPLSSMKTTTAGKDAVCVYGHNELNHMHELYYIDTQAGETTKLFSESGCISDVLGDEEALLVAIDSIVYAVHKDEIISLFNAGTTITSIALGMYGIFYATPDEVGYFDPQKNRIILTQQGAKKLLSFNDVLYIWYTDGVLCRIIHTEYFKDFAKAI